MIQNSHCKNLYTYCSNDPVNYNDPTGHWSGKIHEEITFEAYQDHSFFFVQRFYSAYSTHYGGYYLGRFISGLQEGCTLPDVYRGSEKTKDPYFGIIYYDSYDKKFGGNEKNSFWHGGDNEIDDTEKDMHIGKAVKEYNKGNYYYAGLKLGTVLHAVQDIYSHRLNQFLPNSLEEKWNKVEKTKTKINKYLLNYKNGLQSSLYVLYRLNKGSVRKKAKLVGINIVLKGYKKGDKPYKALHALVSDNPYLDYNYTTKKYSPVLFDYMRNSRIKDAISHSKEIFQMFCNSDLKI